MGFFLHIAANLRAKAFQQLAREMVNTKKKVKKKSKNHNNAKQHKNNRSQIRAEQARP